ncbi:uncharacterized protein PAC_08693 [Phialocephala subalpina]|uniref:Uncharacterized protein n=1 Tax=Phialocephala subalpina TaxID=576137 RepID=A0A1L7X1A5_9HELO|nr:uncharacterized protein PAC_08693 [Phialocephala subalpina]
MIQKQLSTALGPPVDQRVKFPFTGTVADTTQDAFMAQQQAVHGLQQVVELSADAGPETQQFELELRAIYWLKAKSDEPVYYVENNNESWRELDERAHRHPVIPLAVDGNGGRSAPVYLAAMVASFDDLPYKRWYARRSTRLDYSHAIPLRMEFSNKYSYVRTDRALRIPRSCVTGYPRTEKTWQLLRLDSASHDYLVHALPLPDFDLPILATSAMAPLASAQQTLPPLTLTPSTFAQDTYAQLPTLNSPALPSSRPSQQILKLPNRQRTQRRAPKRKPTSSSPHIVEHFPYEGLVSWIPFTKECTEDILR